MQFHRSRSRTRRPARRRGILLLIVLSLLILFVLVCITFIVVAGQYRQQALDEAKAERTGDAPEQLLDAALYQVLRGAPNRQSVIGPFSLLEDAYGKDGFRGRTIQATATYGGQLVTLETQFDATTPSAMSFTPHYYAGSVLTFLDGPYAHQSLRIVDSQYSGGTTYLIQCDGSALNIPTTAAQPLSARVVVNGKVFNGAGATQVNEATGFLDPQGTLSVFQYLHPNFQTYHHDDERDFARIVYGKPESHADIQIDSLPVSGSFGADESWDAVDPLNMHMSLISPNLDNFYPPIGFGPNAVSTAAAPIPTIIPSFHRPMLINFLTQFWFQHEQASNGGTDDAVWAALAAPGNELLEHEYHFSVLRPLPGPADSLDENVHPNFTGSNPAAAWVQGATDAENLKRMYEFLTFGPWDVDNDGDLVPDSIWLDIGLPPQRTADGVLYKPLVALLVRDLDGRVNLNTAGIRPDGTATPPPTEVMAGTPATPVDLNSVPYGAGYGPAEIDPTPVLPNNTANAVIASRYADRSIRPALDPSLTTEPGAPGEDVVTPYDWKYQAIPLNPLSLSDPAHTYLTPPDLLGKGRLVLDHVGQPIPFFMGGALEKVNDPYEANLIDKPWFDSPYTDRELEIALRGAEFFDVGSDARTFQLATSADWSRFRHYVTTRSYDIPIPNQQIPEEFRSLTYPLTGATARPVRSIVDLFYARLAVGGANALDDQVNLMVPFEILRGGKFDINRPFGNGVDDNSPSEPGYGVADEPGELSTTNPDPTLNRADNGLLGAAGARIYERQIYARQLYCLMLMLIADNYRAPEFEGDATIDALELTRRQIAQWVVNVVDYRDSDAIMTPFEYDVNPYNGWQVDGNPETTNEHADRRIVWGQEYSELVMTEAVAFHDRGVRDTDIDDSNDQLDTRFRDPARDNLDPNDPTVTADDDLDQFRMPQGSLFLEFYCARSPLSGATTVPRELYGIQGNMPYLDLGRLAPADPANPNLRAPIWRVAISETNSTEFLNLQNYLTKRFPITSYEMPGNPSRMIWDLGSTTGVPNQITLERFAWFAPLDPTGHPIAGNANTEVYYSQAGSFGAASNPQNQVPSDVLLGTNQYCVIGPRQLTTIGAVTPGVTGTVVPGGNSTYNPSNQRMIISGGQFEARDLTDQLIRPTDSGGAPVNPRPILGITVAAKAPASWTPPIAEPIGLSVSEPLPQSGRYYDKPPQVPIIPTLPEAYGDFTKARAAGTNEIPDMPFDSQPNMPLQGLTQTGTYAQNFRVAFLQRLANPLKPWNPVVDATDTLEWNPYITIDWIPIDLTVFSGVEDTDRQITVHGNPQWLDPADPDPFGAAAPEEQFESREKGDPTNGFEYVLFTGVTVPPRDTPRSGGAAYFDINLRHSLGFVNSVDNTWFAKTPSGSLSSFYAASPERAFPWMTWKNSPFISQYELLQVPKTPSASAFLQFSPKVTSSNPVDGMTPLDSLGRFTHLLNFEHSGAPGTNDPDYPDFSRLLDYVEVPSRYAGTRKWFNPASASVNPWIPFDADPSPPGYWAPFANMSRFRDPGKINVNTIHERAVWQALMAKHPESALKWDEFLISRRAQEHASLPNPTLFANPFRTAASADLMPIIKAPLDPLTPVIDMRKPSADVTLFRRVNHPLNQDRGLFEPTVITSLSHPYIDPERNSFYHHQGVERLGNLVTNHSNVYACWITVGYFELEQARNNAGVRVGEYNRLGQEVGWDTGDTKRHRAFYIIDRSVPVAFEPGENHNVDNCIMVRRYIE